MGQAHDAALPADGSRFGAMFFFPRNPEPPWVNHNFSAMSCPSLGNCTVVGGYENNQHYEGGVLLDQTNGRWARGIKEPLPRDASRLQRNALPHNEPTAVSCASAGNCTAVGYYSAGRAFERQGLLLSEVNGTWARGVRAPLPSDAYGGNVELNSVSCCGGGKLCGCRQLRR